MYLGSNESNKSMVLRKSIVKIMHLIIFYTTAVLISWYMVFYLRADKYVVYFALMIVTYIVGIRIGDKVGDIMSGSTESKNNADIDIWSYIKYCTEAVFESGFMAIRVYKEDCRNDEEYEEWKIELSYESKYANEINSKHIKMLDDMLEKINAFVSRWEAIADENYFDFNVYIKVRR